jgi:3-hydroxybutyryl-CoA dehydrogenase
LTPPTAGGWALNRDPSLSDLADATLLIEAIPERLALKHALYAELETLIADEAIIASNTSGLPPDSWRRACAIRNGY